jgi:hypothetical protein
MATALICVSAIDAREFYRAFFAAGRDRVDRLLNLRGLHILRRAPLRAVARSYGPTNSQSMPGVRRDCINAREGGCRLNHGEGQVPSFASRM